jgi:hypothetical protein
VNGAGDLMTEKYAGDNVEAIEIWNWYKRSLVSHANPSIPKNYWGLSSFENGIKIPKGARVQFRNRSDLYENFDDPYSTGPGSYFEWIKNNTPSIIDCDQSRGFEPV